MTKCIQNNSNPKFTISLLLNAFTPKFIHNINTLKFIHNISNPISFTMLEWQSKFTYLYF